MLFELSKILNIFISPIAWIIISLVCAIYIKNKLYKKVFIFVSLVLFLFFTNMPILNSIRYKSNEKYANVTYPTKHYQLAIVMGGFGSCMDGQTGELLFVEKRAGRLWEAVRLLKKKKIDKILITGDASSMINEDGKSTKNLFLRYIEEIGIPDSVFIFEQQARNTRENAFYTKQIMAKLRISDKNCLLITSATHIDRSLKCFANEGLHLDYYPISPYKRLEEKLSYRDFYPTWKACVGWEELFNEWFGNLVYAVMG